MRKTQSGEWVDGRGIERGSVKNPQPRGRQGWRGDSAAQTPRVQLGHTLKQEVQHITVLTTYPCLSARILPASLAPCSPFSRR